MLIIPSILTDSVEVVQSQLDRLKQETVLSRVQIDIVDSEFAPEITITPIDLASVDLHEFEIDIHLMTNDPINDVVECSEVKGIKTIIAQVEHMSSQKEFIDHVESYKISAGLSLDIYTPVEAIEMMSLSKIKVVQLMSNEAGTQGQSFKTELVLPKIQHFMDIKNQNGYDFEILVDIGINPETIILVEGAGASGVAVGSFLWKSDNLAHVVEQLGGKK